MRRNFFNFFALLIIPLSLGLFIRLKAYNYWKTHSDMFFLNDKTPIFSTMDAYFYARFSKDFLEGAYQPGKLDTLRNVPHYLRYPKLPLISFLFARASKITHNSLESTSVWLIPFLAVLVVFPLTVLGYALKDEWIGFWASIITVISYGYLVRTSICAMDTDALNLFFPLCLSVTSFLIYRYNQVFKKLVFFILFILLSVCWKLWYGHVFFILVWWCVFLFVVLINILVNFKSGGVFSKNNIFNYLILFITCCIIIINRNFHITFTKLHKKLFYALRHLEMSYQKILVSELARPDFYKFAKYAIGNYFLLAISLLGLLILLIKRRQIVLIVCFFPFITLGILSFKAGTRLTMYVPPVLGIGLGAVFSEIWNYFQRVSIRQNFIFFLKFALFAFTFVGVLISNARSFSFIPQPAVITNVANSLVNLEKLTEKNSWVWTWWDLGYPLVYYSKRANYVDGGNQNLYKIYLIGRSFLETDPEIARKIILFSSNRKTYSAIRRNLNRRHKLIFPKTKLKIKSPIYAIFSYDLFFKLGSIRRIVANNFERKISDKGVFFPLIACTQKGPYPYIYCLPDIKIDLIKLKVNINDSSYDIKNIIIKNNVNGRIEKRKYRNNGLYYEIVISKDGNQIAFIMDESYYNTIFNKMFILRNCNKKIFKLVYDNFPWLVAYRVNLYGN